VLNHIPRMAVCLLRIVAHSRNWPHLNILRLYELSYQSLADREHQSLHCEASLGLTWKDEK
jgi:hypothetical protein